MQSTASITSRRSAARANRRHNDHTNTEQDKNEHDDVADRHCCFSLRTSTSVCSARPLTSGPAQYEQTTVGTTQETRVDQGLQQRLTRARLQGPEALRLLNRETQPGHLEKLSSDSANEALVARLALGSTRHTRNRARPRRRIARRERVVEDLIDVRRRPPFSPPLML